MILILRLTMTMSRRHYSDVVRLRDWTASGVHTHRQRNLVVFYANYHLFLHRKSNFVPDNGAHEIAHRIGRGPR